MKSTIIIMIAVVAALALAACGSVTETGNPIYENDTFGIQIEYPTGWEQGGQADDAAFEAPTDPEPMAAGAVACFESGTEGTNACVYMSFLDPVPESLIAYLMEEWPEREFTAYGTSTLSGYTYDDPADGPNGGDLREYYFLNGDVFVRVIAEVFPGGETQLTAFLNGISFQ